MRSRGDLELFRERRELALLRLVTCARSPDSERVAILGPRTPRLTQRSRVAPPDSALMEGRQKRRGFRLASFRRVPRKIIRRELFIRHSRIVFPI